MTEEQNNLPQIPEGWVWTNLGEILFRSNKKFNPLSSPEEKFVGLRHIKSGTGRLLKFGKSTETKSLKTKFRKGDILYGKLRPYLNKVHVAGFNGVCSTDILVFSKNDFVDNRHIARFLQTHGFVRYATQHMSGVQHPRVNYETISKYPIALPPLAEQHRIVAKLKELFTKLNVGVESLGKVKAELQCYRQAVLKHAHEGKLTKEWRKTHKYEIEPASVRLERSLKEKQRKWEQEQLATMKAKGRIPKTNKWKLKYKKPDMIDSSDLPKLPKFWSWTNFEQVADNVPNAIKAGPFGSALKKTFYVSKGYKVYGQEQVIRNDPFYGDYYIDSKRYEKLKSCMVKPGDILISLVGTIGKVLILPEGIEPGIINPRLVKLSLDKNLVNSQYIKTYLTSNFVKTYFSLLAHGGTMNILNLTVLKGLPIKLPPLDEQEMILEEVERLSSLNENLGRIIHDSLFRAERLRQSILKTAFEGRLVAQDPNDEPAEKLLRRIREWREKHNVEKKKIKFGRSRREQLELSHYVK